MRFNDKELVHLSLGQSDMEGVLNHKRPPSGNFSQYGYKERLFKLRCNLLFYFRISEIGQIDDKQPAGVIILENFNLQYEVCTGVPFAFSITFGDEPERKHLFSGRSETYIYEWVNALRRSRGMQSIKDGLKHYNYQCNTVSCTKNFIKKGHGAHKLYLARLEEKRIEAERNYEHWRSQLILLQSKISSKTGKDPLLMCPHNQGQVRDIEPAASPVFGRKMKPVGKKASTFQSHVAAMPTKDTTTFQSHVAAMPTNESMTFQSHVAAMPTNKSTTNTDTNLIEF
uniref:Pleckstrin homology domain-containing family J member 1 n=1 Tax=Timema tahoe TaxID=61484 RepID=A0A7R9NZW3_9NEOP|nr:unnamed protein product [Timema tahoe]